MLSEYSTADDHGDDKLPSKTTQCNDPSHRRLQWALRLWIFSFICAQVAILFSMMTIRRLTDACQLDSKPKGSSLIPPSMLVLTCQLPQC